MPQIQIPGLSWASQPQGLVKARPELGVDHAWHCGLSPVAKAFDLVDNDSSLACVTGTANSTTSGIGLLTPNTSTVNVAGYRGTGLSLPSCSKKTVVALFDWASGGSNGPQGVIQLSAGIGSGIAIIYRTTPQKWCFVINGTEIQGLVDTISERKVIVARYKYPNMELWVNGKLHASGTGAPASVAEQTGVSIGGGVSTDVIASATSLKGTSIIAYTMNDWISDGGVSLLSANPWQIFAPQPRTIFIPAAGGGATASIVITTDDATVSGGASVSPVAALSVTTDDAAFAGTAGTSASASLAITTEDSAFSGSAQVSPIAGFALSTDAAAFSGGASVSAIAVLGISTDDAVFAGSAQVSPIAGFALTTDSAIFSGSAGVGVSASMAVTLSDSIFSGSASVSPIAGFSVTTDSSIFAGSAGVGYFTAAQLAEILAYIQENLVVPTAEQNAAAVGARLVEGAMSQDAMTRVILAALAGRTDGVGTPTEKYKSVDGVKDRITVSFDASSNRTTIVLDGA